MALEWTTRHGQPTKVKGAFQVIQVQVFSRSESFVGASQCVGYRCVLLRNCGRSLLAPDHRWFLVTRLVKRKHWILRGSRLQVVTLCSLFFMVESDQPGSNSWNPARKYQVGGTPDGLYGLYICGEGIKRGWRPQVRHVAIL